MSVIHRVENAAAFSCAVKRAQRGNGPQLSTSTYVGLDILKDARLSSFTARSRRGLNTPHTQIVRLAMASKLRSARNFSNDTDAAAGNGDTLVVVMAVAEPRHHVTVCLEVGYNLLGTVRHNLKCFS